MVSARDFVGNCCWRQGSQLVPMSISVRRMPHHRNLFDEMQQRGGGGADRLSALPDAVLLRIMSHLRAWQAVRTSVLSRRWRDVWASATRLDIRHPCACDERADEERFHKFVKTLLLKRRPLVPIKALRLRWSHDKVDVNSWIIHAVRRGVEQIELSTARRHKRYRAPEYASFRLSIINCLVMVTSAGFLVDAPNLISLRCIRPFHIVPTFMHMGSLVEATVVLDDSCLRAELAGFEQPKPVLLRKKLLENCPIFNNLNTLSLGEWCVVPDFNALSTIIGNSPNVERLYLQLDMNIKGIGGGIDPRAGIGSFACKNLKKVKITCCKDDVMVHMLAQFLQGNGISLEKIFVRRISSAHIGEEGRGRDSIAKRKAHDEVLLVKRAGEAGPSAAAAGGGGGGADRISALPDAVLLRIMSHLKAWQAVRTSVLSTRWRDVWASATRLDIRHPCACDERADEESFHTFVKTLLLKRRPLVPIKALRLRWSHDEVDVNSWIIHAVRRGAEEIDLSARRHDGYHVPDYASFISLNIKILKLTHLGNGTDALEMLCSRCTRLEELKLEDIRSLSGGIQSDSLKRLYIINCRVVDGLLVDAPNLISLRCIRPLRIVPAFMHMGSLVEATVLLDDSHLRAGLAGIQRPKPVLEDDDNGSDYDDAFFALPGAEVSDDKGDGESGNNSEAPSDDDDDDDDDQTVAYGEIAHEASSYDSPSDEYGANHRSVPDDYTIRGGDYMLHNLSHVRTLGLLGHQGEVVLRKQLLESCPIFNNLNTLSLGGWCMVPDFNALSTILRNSPNVERLYLHLDMKIKGIGGRINPRERIGSFACKNLKKIQITRCKDDAMVHKLAVFLEANGVQRERIFICRTPSTRTGKKGRDSREKRKAQDDVLRQAAKQRRVRSSRSPE
uniref:F-box domain-containing protein n=1 Tax=Leersia perrieri TaxID=77586 RepID=A0A0D9X594_9ORYZ